MKVLKFILRSQGNKGASIITDFFLLMLYQIQLKKQHGHDLKLWNKVIPV